ncbi:hypothetical protein [Xanthovirga aplysinae]|uniref:hypothetical protein n=1 Tax=Xanthovirga aplysinae TaxID=2529853 RepID=UPI0012BC17D4|nr:hypothetical protein [Xanthovirga aplysinae]MTI31694.1 hypothetical protein [Xanthovirga aplysinae]
MKLNKYLPLAGLTLLFASCQPEVEAPNPNPSPGEADFSKYVALGNSLTSGYSDGALYLEGQENSYPAIFAQQLEAVGGGEFTQPLVPSGNGLGSDGNGKFVLQLVNGSPLPVPTPGDVQGVGTPIGGEGIYFNNMGVPGAESGHLLVPGYGQANPFFGRFATSPATSVLADAAAQQPSLFYPLDRK